MVKGMLLKVGGKPKRYLEFTKNGKRKAYTGAAMHQKISGGSIGTSARLSAGIIPAKKNFKLRYAETIVFTTGVAGVIGTINLFRLNSLFDPNQTGLGHQPYLYDTITPLYNFYRVNSVKVELLWSTIGGTPEVCAAYAVQPSSTFTSLAGMTVDRATESNAVSTAILGSSGDGRTVKQSFTIKLHKLEGIPKSKWISSGSYEAAINASPASNLTLQIGIGSYSFIAGQAATCQVVLTYSSTFWGVITQTQS